MFTALGGLLVPVAGCLDGDNDERAGAVVRAESVETTPVTPADAGSLPDSVVVDDLLALLADGGDVPHRYERKEYARIRQPGAATVVYDADEFTTETETVIEALREAPAADGNGESRRFVRHEGQSVAFQITIRFQTPA